MSIVRSPVRSVVRSPVRGVFGGADTQTDLQRLLALSPSLLIWPANGAGWQGTSGGTLAASGQPLGLGADLSQLQGKTLSEWLATATNIRNTGATGSAGTVGAPSYNTTTGEASLPRVDAANQTFVIFSGTASKTYAVEINNTTANAVTVRSGATVLATVAGNTTAVSVVTIASGQSLAVYPSANGVTQTCTINYVKELPGNHLRAGTWASPADAARGTLQVSGGVTWIDPDATSDAYSFLTALSARAIVARVRVPTGYNANGRLLVRDTEATRVTTSAGSWSNTGSGSTRVDGASTAVFALDTWQTLTIEWGSAQTFERMFWSAVAGQLGSMDVAALMVMASPFASTADRGVAEAIIGATA